MQRISFAPHLSLFFSAVWLSVVATAANATTATSATPANVSTAPIATSSPFSLVSGLVFLLALIFVAAWLVRRSGGAQWQATRAIKIVTSLSVGPRERVVLIEMAGQQWLLGVASGSVNVLHHFEQPVLQDQGGGDDFAHKIRQILQQGLGK